MLEVKNVFVAGADGFESNRENYYWDSQNTLSNLDKNYNVSVARAVKMIGLDISYIKESVYEHIV